MTDDKYRHQKELYENIVIGKILCPIPTVSKKEQVAPKPCVFCGEEKALTMQYDPDGCVSVCCNWCGANGPRSIDDESAIRKWNEGCIRD